MNILKAATLLAPLLLAGCEIHEGGPPRSRSQIVELQGAERVHAELHMAAGVLRVSGGAKPLLDANFRTNFPRLPDVKYDVSIGRGRLIIGGQKSMVGGDLENEWNLKFTDEVPLELEVHLGAGENRLELATLDLRSVEVHMGVGELQMDLTGNYRRNVDVTVKGGIGEATLRLPRNVGVIAEARGGIGNISARGGLRKHDDRWVNDAYDKAKIVMRVEVHGGIGSINLVGAE